MAETTRTDKIDITDDELIHRASQVDETSLADIDTEPMYINVGPTHPATHGTYRIFCKLDGERIERAAVEIGYLHRGFEKIVEIKQYTQVIPYTDRLNYSSGLVNNVGYCKAVERMLGVEITPRTEIIRVLICEIQRIMDHMICVGTNLVDVGALTNFWYFFNAREKLNETLGYAMKEFGKDSLEEAAVYLSFARIHRGDESSKIYDENLGKAKAITDVYEAEPSVDYAEGLREVASEYYILKLYSESRKFYERELQIYNEIEQGEEGENVTIRVDASNKFLWCLFISKGHLSLEAYKLV